MKTKTIFLLTLGGLCAVAHGQADNPPNPDPNDAPPVRGAAPVRALPDPNEIQVPPEGTWELASADGNDIALLYNQLTGKRVLVSAAASSVEISIIMPGPLTKGEMAILLEKKLLMEGLSLETSGAMEMKLVLQAGGPTNTPLENQVMVNDLNELPTNSEQYVTWFMKLENLKPEEAVRTFGQIMGQLGPAGKISAVPHASGVILSGNTPMLRKIDKIRREIDVPSATVGQRFVPVVYADVEELATQLNEIFNETSNSTTTSRVERAQPQAGVGGIPGLAQNAGAGLGVGDGAGAGEETPVNIIPDVRTNRIFLMGRPVDIAFVESLIREFDQKSSDRNFLRRKLRYLPVYEFMPVAQNAIERTLGGTSSGGSSSLPGGASTGRTSTANRTSASRSSNTTQSNRSNIGGTTGGTTGGSRAGVAGQEGTTAPESYIIGKTLLVSDNITNSIVVQGPPHHVEIIEQLLDELDVPSQQVAITAVFGSYDLDDGTSFGVDIAGIAFGNDRFAFDNRQIGGARNLGGFTGVGDFLNPAAGAVGANPLAGLNLYGQIGDEFSAFVNMLETNSKFTSLSRPTIFTTNNKIARISSGRRVAVPTSSFNGVGTGGQSTNVEYRDVTLELEILPLINDRNEVTLDISLVRDALSGDERTIGNLGNIPDITTEEVNTIVTVPNQGTIVLGGLITETTTESKDGIPILSQIPVLGGLFGDQSDSVTRNELVILIHPTIINDHVDLDSYQRISDQDSTVAGQARDSVSGMILPPRGLVPAPTEKGTPQAPVMAAPQRGTAPAPAPKAKRSGVRNGKRF